MGVAEELGQLYHGVGCWWPENIEPYREKIYEIMKRDLNANVTRGVSPLGFTSKFFMGEITFDDLVSQSKSSLSLMEKHGIKALMDVFDYERFIKKPNLDFIQGIIYLSKFITEFKDDERILGWGILSEGDLSNPEVVWANRIVSWVIKNIDKRPIYSIGWRYDHDWHNAKHIPLFIDFVDVVGMNMYPPHGRGNGMLYKYKKWFDNPELVKNYYERQYAELLKEARNYAEGKPLIVTECGVDFQNAETFYGFKTETVCAKFFEGVLQAFKDEAIPVVCLYNINPSQSDGFSLLKPNGQWREVAAVIKRFFTEGV